MGRQVTGRMFPRNGVWYFTYTYQGHKTTMSLRTRDELVAKRLFEREMTCRQAAIIDGTHGEKYGDEKAPSSVGKVLLSNAWQVYVESANRPRPEEGTMGNYHSQVTCLCSWIITNYPKAIYMTDVSYQMASKFMAYLREVRKLSNNSQGKYIDTMRRLWRVVGVELAQANGGSVNPLYKDSVWTLITKPADVPEPREAFSLDEALLLLRKAVGWMKTLFHLGLYTGLRLKDCCLMRWERIHFDTGHIEVRPHKTRRSSAGGKKWPKLKMHPELVRHLRELAKKANYPRSGYVLPKVARRYMRDHAAITDDIQSFLEVQGYETQRPPEDKRRKRNVVNYGFHSLKHCFVTVCTNSGVPAATIEQIAGRSYRIYQHVEQESMDKVVAAFTSAEAQPSWEDLLENVPDDVLLAQVRKRKSG